MTKIQKLERPIHLDFRWGTSRGRDSYGYNICTLYADGARVASCNGGGYDMTGTSLGDYIAKRFADRLLKLKPKDMPSHSHWEPKRARVCGDKCHEAHHEALMQAIVKETERPDDLPDLPED